MINLKGCSGLSATLVDCASVSVVPVCSVKMRKYLRVEPTVLWVLSNTVNVTYVESNTDWRIE